MDFLHLQVPNTIALFSLVELNGSSDQTPYNSNFHKNSCEDREIDLQLEECKNVPLTEETNLVQQTCTPTYLRNKESG